MGATFIFGTVSIIAFFVIVAVKSGKSIFG